MEILKEYHTIDKRKWPRGEWNKEPDIVNLWDEDSGLYCQVVRHGDFGNFCGYVFLPKSHTYYEEDYDNIPFNVHGGLTYAGFPSLGITDPAFCPVMYEFDPGLPYLIGFDCSHSGDVSPGLNRYGFRGDTYKNITFVINELKELCKQLNGK